MAKIKKNLIGFLGGSFDPPHKGHLKIGVESIKNFKLDKLYWIITNKNPFKKKPFFKISERIKRCKIITKENKKIEVKFLEKLIKSPRTIDILKYLIRKNKNSKFFLIIGSDNLINFHKWKKYKELLKLCKLVVFSRHGFDQKAKKSFVVRKMAKKEIIYIKNSKINISSSQLRKFYLR